MTRVIYNMETDSIALMRSMSSCYIISNDGIAWRVILPRRFKSFLRASCVLGAA